MAEVNLRIIPSEFIKIIPMFNGDGRHINLFLRKCEYIIERFRGDQAQNEYVMQVITSRLTDNAAALISERSDVETWAEFKELLQIHFGDPRSEECIAMTLESLKIKTGETYLEFCNRVKSIRANLIAKVNLLDDVQMRSSKITIYNKLALNVFLFNLPENMVRIVRLHGPNTLEDALSVVLEEVNFHEQYQAKNKTNTSAIAKPQAPLVPTPQQSTSFVSTPQFKFGNNLPVQNQGFGSRTFMPNQNTNTQNQFKFGIPQFKFGIPQSRFPIPHQFQNRPVQTTQFGYRPQFNPQAGRPAPYGYRPVGLQQLPPMRPQQFGQQQGYRPPQQVAQPSFPSDVTMRTAPPLKHSFHVNETELYETDYPYYMEDPYVPEYNSYNEDSSYYYNSCSFDTDEQCTPTLALEEASADKTECAMSAYDSNQDDNKQTRNFHVHASIGARKK
ncbi:uncharacterized protein LOC126382118 [Pectinophora gossypiella]|uniref:uncharacterized protein LOC126381154 n=1 Tax=Pectinophora gossypiella TaxID=13191 RepID=UPI00214E5D38|nr:uncharacterized protein LOC126381154 [Pectinophora gossypiella]XP_049887822.1 uncharacterized protein LOC126382118 [Pectinophora gossypiella]